MINLVESIMADDLLSASEIFENKLAEIMEKKLYEVKRRVAADIQEVFGALSKKDIEDRRKAGYRKASEVLVDPRAKENLSPAARKIKQAEKKRKVSEEALDEAGLAPSSLRARIYKKGLKAIGDFEKRGAARRNLPPEPDSSSQETPRNPSAMKQSSVPRDASSMKAPTYADKTNRGDKVTRVLKKRADPKKMGALAGKLAWNVLTRDISG